MKRMGIPHPSVTGLASGLLIGDFMNSGYDRGSSVIKDLFAGNFEGAINKAMVYIPALITTKKGQQTMVKAVAVASAGAIARKWANNPKLGGNKLYFRI